MVNKRESKKYVRKKVLKWRSRRIDLKSLRGSAEAPRPDTDVVKDDPHSGRLNEQPGG